jgi:hypothetical protein
LIDHEESIYLDIPAGTIAVGSSAELRAIFIEPWAIDLHEPEPNGEVEERVLRFCVVITPRGEFGWRHLLWQDDRTICVADNVPVANANGRATPTFDEILRGADLAVERLQDDVERLAYVALERARKMELIVQEPGARDAHLNAEDIPFLRADHPRRAPGRAHETHDRFSLFHVRRLVARTPVAMREATIERQPWQLGRRITVKAHWRQQPVGPRGSGKRQRIWIAEHHKGPVAGLPRQPMQQL